MTHGVLDFAIVEKLPARTCLFQVDDGTIFYRDAKYGDRLFVKWQDKEVEAKIPCPVSSCISAYENAIYFKSNELQEKIYKADFSPSGCIDISLVRDLLEDERVESSGLLSRIMNGRKHVYRMGDDPEGDGVIVDSSYAGIVPGAVHRGMTINFLETSNGSQLLALKLGERAILVEGPAGSSIKHFSSDSSKLLYFAYANQLYVLDNETMHIARLKTCNIDAISAIIGVHDGILTIIGKKGNVDYVMRAELPKGFFE